MLAMGFKLHLCGSSYLCEAIKYCYQLSDNEKVSFSGQVYPYVAQKRNSTVRNVARDIRTTIQSCYNGGKMFTFNEICGYELISQQYPPTNSELIMNIVAWIKTCQEEYDPHNA